MSSTFPPKARLPSPFWKRWLRLPPLLAALLLGAAGCKRDDTAPYPEWIPANHEAVRRGAYAELRQVGIEAEAAVRGIQHRAAPTTKEVHEIDAKLGPLMDAVQRSCKQPMVDDYAPTISLAPDPSRIGWAYLGGCYQRRLHAAVAKRDYAEAAKVMAEGTRFALFIACGDASDALVGYPIADRLRATLAPLLREMDADQLSKLSKAIAAALIDAQPRDAVAAHEGMAMMAALQAVQDAYRDGRIAPLAEQFGPSTRDAFDTLEGYKGRAETKRVAFFNAMAADVTTESNWLLGASRAPASKRDPEPNPKPSTKQPWHALARQLVLAGGAMLSAGDLTLARTRLMAISCDLYAIGKTAGAAPADLRMFPAELNRDPYTGRPFYYVPEGMDFKLYSAGVDGIDNGGDSDDTGTRPDVVLEGGF